MIDLWKLTPGTIRRLHAATEGELGREAVDIKNEGLDAHIVVSQEPVTPSQRNRWTILLMGRRGQETRRWKSWTIDVADQRTLAALVAVQARSAIEVGRAHEAWVKQCLEAISEGREVPSKVTGSLA